MRAAWLTIKIWWLERKTRRLQRELEEHERTFYNFWGMSVDEYQEMIARLRPRYGSYYNREDVTARGEEI